MEPQRATLAVCIFAALVFVGSGFEFQLSDETPFNNQLVCSASTNTSSLDIFSVIRLTISDVTNKLTAVKLASVSVLDTGLYIDHYIKAYIDVHGSITPQIAELVITFSNQTYCSFCSYLCELTYIASTGNPVVVQKSVRANQNNGESPSNEISVGTANQLAAAVNRLTDVADGIESSLTTLTQKLDKKLDNIADLLTKGAVGTEAKPDECYKGMASLNVPPRKVITVLGNRTALCDTMTDGGGWIVFQRRANGQEDFYRNWTDYRYGFGQVANGGDYWLGNDAIHELSFMGTFELRIDMEYAGKKYYAQYGKFFLEGLATKYRLNIGNYSGDAPDSNSFIYSNNWSFSTFDMDSDGSSGNCAVSNHEAWWYNSCSNSGLNRAWGTLYWHQLGNRITFSEMKMRLI